MLVFKESTDLTEMCSNEKKIVLISFANQTINMGICMQWETFKFWKKFNGNHCLKH